MRCSVLPPHLNFIRKATVCLHAFIPICADRVTVGMVILMTLKGCTKAELLWLIDWMCTHSMFWHDIEIERALNALELEREQKKLDEADRLNEESARLRQQAAELLTPYEGKPILDIPADVLDHASAILEEAQALEEKWNRLMKV